MELELIRTYYPAGTNGKIQYQNRLMMYSIELPWKDNLAQVSCIPEGRYEMVKKNPFFSEIDSSFSNLKTVQDVSLEPEKDGDIYIIHALIDSW